MVTYPIKFVLAMEFAAPMLAGLAFDRLQQSQGEGRPAQERRLVILGGLLLALVAPILLWARRFPFPADDFGATLHNGLTRGVFLVAAVVLLEAITRAKKPATPQIVSLVLLAVFWLNVCTHEPPQNPTVPPWIYAPDLARTKLSMKPQPALGESRAMVRPAADMGFGEAITSDPKDNFLAKLMGYFADCNLLDAVPKVNGIFSLHPHECGELASVLYGSTNAYLECLADFKSVSKITAPGQFVECVPQDTFLPLITAGQRPVYLDDPNALRTLVRPGFDPRTSVILPPDARAFVTVTNQTVARVIPGKFTATRVELELEADRPSLVVISQTYYHPWHAFVDDKPIRLLRANYVFQALEAPAGRHRLHLVYEDHALHLGFALSGLSLVVCLVFWSFARTRVRAAAL
jgi:hypothetical protein